MGRTGGTCLLLTLSCLVHCVRSDGSTAITTTNKPLTSTPPPTAAPGTTVEASTTTAPVQSTAVATPTPTVTTEQTTLAPTTAAPTSTAPPMNPGTTTPPSTPAPTATTDKPSASTGGGGAAIITTVSKQDQTTAGPKSSSPSSPAPPSPAVTTMPGAPDSTTVSPKPLTPSPGTVPGVPGGSGTETTTVTIIVPTATVTGPALGDATTKHDTKDAAGTTVAVTRNTSPDQKLSPAGSTAPPVVPQTSESTSKPSTAVTGGKSGADPVLVGSTQSGVQTTDRQTTDRQTTVAPTTSTTVTTTTPKLSVFSYCLNKGHQSEEKDLVSLCQRLMASLEDGNCTISYRHHQDKILFDSVEITGKVKTNIVSQIFDDITKKPTDNRTLITILASCGALLIMIIILAVCASHHRKPYNENQMHLTEELQTVENGYHDNPTLEVMEVGADMQEKKPPLSLNNGGEFNDSWIVPIDNLLKEEGPDEEDTHL